MTTDNTAAHPVPAGPAHHETAEQPAPGPTGPEAATDAAKLLHAAGEHVHLVADGQAECLLVDGCALLEASR